MNKIKNKIKNIFEFIKINFITEETLELFKDIYEIKDDKYKNYKIIFWFMSLPFTFVFLILNLIVYLTCLILYYFIFCFKLFLIRVLKKNAKKMFFKRKFLFLKKSILICLKNIFFDYPRCRAFFVFYNVSKNIIEKNKLNKEEKIFLIKYLLKSIFNRVLIRIILGVPYMVLYCNTRFINKIFMIYNFKKKTEINGKTSFINLLFAIIINIDRDLSPNYIIYIKKFKIKFFKKKIVFNPGEKLAKKILELAEKTKLNKQIEKIKKETFINQNRNIKEINENGDKKWSTPHIETILPINEEEIISINETSKPKIINNFDNSSVNNLIYGKCSYKSGQCYITQPILSRFEYKNFYNEKFNNTIYNINKDKINYNQTFGMICKLKKGFIVIEKKIINNKIIFNYKEDKKDLIEIIRENKFNIKNSTYEALENSNYFIEKIEEINNNLPLEDKITIINHSCTHNLIKNNNDLYQILKLK